MSPSRRSVRGLARLYRSHSCTARPAVRPSAPRLNSFAVIPIEIVITGLDPVIHLPRKNLLRRWMDARIKSGHDERVLSSTPLSQDAESLVFVGWAKALFAPCPPHGVNWWARCALPTLR